LSGYCNSLSIIKVKRITKTQIILENGIKLRNDSIKMYGENQGYCLKAIRRSAWNKTNYYIENEDIKARYKYEQLYLKTKRKFESLKLKELTVEQLNILLSAMIQTTPTENKSIEEQETN